MKKHLVKFCGALLITMTAFTFAFAADSTFQTQLSVIPDDMADPTIPTGLVATAVSSSQINLVWNASTDDIGVTGYRIFRDSGIIATTSGLTYSDSGLVASTTYEYTVEAFDGTLKYSGQSAAASSTTFAAPVIPPTTGGGTTSSGYSELQITGLSVAALQDSATVTFGTSRAAQVKLYWGVTGDYELGSVSGAFYNIVHSVKISTLSPGTNYFYKVEATDGYGKIRIVEGSFQTQNVIVESLLTNVTDFRAIPKENSIALSWKNPSSPVFDSVRIVRSDKFFPRDILDGSTIFEGSLENYQDQDVVVGVTYYYSIFAKDSDGNYSSGVLAQARIKPAGEIGGPATSTDPFIDIPVLMNVHPAISKLTISDFDFIQSSIKLENTGTGVVIDGSKNLTISLNYNKVPEILKTIAITLIDPDDSTQVFPFLLRVNKDKTAYDATLAPLGKSGTYKMKITVLDYKNQGLKKIDGSLKAFVFDQVKDLASNPATFRRNMTWFTLILLAVLVVLAVLHRKRKNEI